MKHIGMTFLPRFLHDIFGNVLHSFPVCVCVCVCVCERERVCDLCIFKKLQETDKIMSV